MRTRGHHFAESRSCQTRRARRSHARKTARRTCCWFAPGWRYSVRSCKIWSMPACCGCHMGGGGGAAMVSPRPRPSRVSFDRSSRDGDGQTIGSRLVNGGTVRRRAPLAVTPGRLNRSPIRVSKTRRLARGTRQWRLGAAVTVPVIRRADCDECPPRNAFSRDAQKKVPQCTSARSSAHVRPRTRLESRRETRARCGVRGAHPLHIRVRAVGPRGASPARPPRASAGFPRSRSALSFFAGGGNESSSRTRGSRPCAHAVSLRESRAPPVTHKRSSLRHAHARSQHARSRETAS